MLDISDVTITKTTCAYCGVGCGIAVKQEIHAGQVIHVDGDVKHPANMGRLCIKGANLDSTLVQAGRLLTAQVDGEPVNSEKAYDAVAQRLQQVISEHGPEAVGFYLSGQLLTEDYYIANKLCKGFIGSPNLDTNSRLCMSSAVVAQQRAFGEDLVPGCYDDLEQADLVLLVGSNMAWTHPIVFQRLLKARERNPAMKIVVLDPKQTATAQLADMHLALAPASDGYFFTGLLAYLNQQDALDLDYIQAHTEGFSEALAAALVATPDIASVARQCDLSAAQVAKIFAAFANTDKVVSVYSQGVNQSNTGSDKANAIINCHLATGKIGRPGACPFSITGQPNAMGGREVGGMATQLAAHRSYDDPQQRAQVKQFWQAPQLPEQAGYKAVELFDAVSDGRIKAIWIMGSNPVVSLPNADKVQRALEQCPLVIVSETHANTDTAACADILLPASGWGEKDGTVTNSERMISRQRAFAPTPQGVRQDWQILSAVAQRMGHGQAFAFTSSADIFREHARLSALEDDTPRQFNLGPLAQISDQQYTDLQPLQWPVHRDDNSATGWQGSPRLFADGQFATPSGKAYCYAVSPALAQGESSQDYPLWLNSGRWRDQWHSMSRTGEVAQLSKHEPEPRIEMHPFDAKAYAITDDQWARVSSAQGDYVARVRTTSSLRQGQLFVPIHWNQQYASKAKASSLVAAIVDVSSGQPQFKQVPVKVAPLTMQWQARLVCRQAVSMAEHEHWVRAPLQDFCQYQLAGNSEFAWVDWLRMVLPEQDETMVLQSSEAHSLRLAVYQKGRLMALLWVAKELPVINDDLIYSLLQQPRLNASQRLQALAGQKGRKVVADKLVCACMQVTASAIDEAIDQGESSLAGLKNKLGCGSGCGSCLGEVQARLNKAYA